MSNRRLPARTVLRFALVTAATLALLSATSRASAPAGRYTISGGTVYDTKTKLTWQQTTSSGTYTWGSASTAGTAQNACAGVDGGSWRVPTVGELLTIVDYSYSASGPPCTTPLIDPTAFPGTACDTPYWTSTPVANSTPQLAWFVGFSDGNTNNDAPTTTNYVRCVH
jgi:Protein of unknown function (DUF1566)